MDVGDQVEVRVRFTEGWARGFEVAAVTHAGQYRLRRVGDGRLLPETTAPEDVRPESSRSPFGR